MPYRDQGTKAFEISPIQRKRRSIRDSSKLRSASMQFWTAAGLGEEQKMDFELYAHIHRRISMALAPELTEDEAREAAIEDWSEDLDGFDPEEGMPFEQYSKGLFGVADMWTETVDELEYVIFINKLFRRVTVLREAPALANSSFAASTVSSLSQSLPPKRQQSEIAKAVSSSVRVGSASEGSAGAFGGLANIAGSLIAAARSLTSPSKTVAVEGTPSTFAQSAASPASEAEGSVGSIEGDREGDRPDSGGSSKGRGLERRPSKSELLAQKSTSLWRGVLPTFRTFRELDEIVPLSAPSKDKPVSSAKPTPAPSTQPRRKTRSKRITKEMDEGVTKERLSAMAARLNEKGKSGGAGKRMPKRLSSRLSKDSVGGESVGGESVGGESVGGESVGANGEGSADGSAGGAASAGAARSIASLEEAADSVAPPSVDVPTTPAEPKRGREWKGTDGAAATPGPSATSPPPVPLQVPSDDEDEEKRAMMSPPKSSFSLKRRGEQGWVDGHGNAIKTPRSLLRTAARERKGMQSPYAAAASPAAEGFTPAGASTRFAELSSPRSRAAASAAAMGPRAAALRAPGSMRGSPMKGGRRVVMVEGAAGDGGDGGDGGGGDLRSILGGGKQRTPRGSMTTPRGRLKGFFPRSPARPEGGTQSDGEEEVNIPSDSPCFLLIPVGPF